MIQQRQMRRRVLVAVEVAAIFLSGTLAAGLLFKNLGIAGAKQAIHTSTRSNFDAAAVAVPMLIRWGLVIGLAFIAGWILGRHTPRDYGMTTAGSGWLSHLGIGLVVYAYVHIPAAIIALLRHYLHLRGGPRVWEEIDRAAWDAEFWMFMLASSIVLPVVFEEIFFRGYAQTDSAQHFAPVRRSFSSRSYSLRLIRSTSMERSSERLR